MQLKLNICGSAEPFIRYLEDFSRIQQDLLLEIDPAAKKFVCKISTESRSCVRYSSISFDDCHMSITEHKGEDELGTNRIKAGILAQLNKFISIVKRFGADTDSSGNSNFSIVINYDKLINKDGTVDYVATKLACVSDVLTMRIDGFRISEFVYLDDEKFKSVIFNVNDKVTFMMDANTINSLIKNSDIMKSKNQTDSIIFCNKGKEMWAKFVQRTGDDPSFEYRVGFLNEEPSYDISLQVFEKNFAIMLNKTDENYNVIIGRRTSATGEPTIDRILFDSLSTDTKMAIAVVNK